MTKLPIATLLLGAALPLGALAQDHEQPESIRVSGRILDASGAPVPGAMAGMIWQLDPTGGPPLPIDGVRPGAEPLRAGADGRFTGELHPWSDEFSLIAYSRDGALAGFVSVSKAAPDGIELVLRPSVKLRGELTCNERGTPPERFFAGFRFGTTHLGSINAEGHSFEVLLPAGECSWMVADEYFTMKEGTATLSPERREHDLGKIDLPLSFLARHEGEVLPEWKVSASRNTAEGRTQLADYRGKWLLVEFWGYW